MLWDVFHELFVVDKAIAVFVADFDHLLDYAAVDGHVTLCIGEGLPFKMESSYYRYILPF